MPKNIDNSTDVTFFEIFPAEMVLRIFSYLELHSLSLLSLVSSDSSRFANDDVLWKNLFFRTYGDDFIDLAYKKGVISEAAVQGGWKERFKNLQAFKVSPTQEMLGTILEVIHANKSTTNSKLLEDLLKQITIINLNDNDIGIDEAIAIAEALETNSSITSIDLGDNNIGDEGAKVIAKALETNSSITSIYLGYNDIGDEGAIAIAETLKANSSITSINLEINNIGDEGTIAIAKALETNSSITSIDLGDNNIDVEGAIAIATALETNSSITSIDLGYNNIDVEGAIAIATALETNSSITSIYLGNNNIGDEGAKAIAKVLKTNSSITSIDLGFNNIGIDGAKAIAKVLETNSSITSIYLGGNNIGDEGTIAIAKALEANSSITSIYLRYNNIGDEGTIAIAKALEANSSITSIDLNYNNIGGERTKTLVDILQKYNFTIISLSVDFGFRMIIGTNLRALIKRNENLAKQYKAINHKIKQHLNITPDDFDDNLIFLAIEKNNMALINILLTIKPELKNHKTPGDMAPAQFAKVKRHTKIQEMLEKRISDKNAHTFFHHSQHQNSAIQPRIDKRTCGL